MYFLPSEMICNPTFEEYGQITYFIQLHRKSEISKFYNFYDFFLTIQVSLNVYLK